MNKAFVKESDDDEEDAPAGAPSLPPGTRNYMTRNGFERLRAELDQLVRVERPALVETVRWAASNGDRSENGDYIYGKKRLREIDRRVRFLVKRLETATVVTPSEQENTEQTYQIVGVDEANASEGRISWIAPLSRALLKAREGDVVRFASPAGVREIEVVEIRYE